MNTNLLCNNENTTCFLCNDTEKPRLVVIDKMKDETFDVTLDQHQILFVLKGKICLSENTTSTTLEAGYFILLPRGHKYTVHIEEDASIVIGWLHNSFIFCENFSIANLYLLNKSIEKHHFTMFPLKMNELLYNLLSDTIIAFAAKLNCCYYHDTKQQEFLYYLRAQYSKNDLAAFFAPILSEDTIFIERIHQNIESAKYISDLANATYYSISGFKKRFLKVFGIPPAVWMKKYKAEKIRHEIHCTKKPFKEIAEKYNFCSLSHFTRFCNKMYGITPTKLRKQNIKL